MARRLRWSERALDDLDAILAHIARGAPLAASAVNARIEARIGSLPDQPGQGRRVPEFDGTLREVIVQSWRVIYQVTDADITVVAVVHSARLLDNVPKS